MLLISRSVLYRYVVHKDRTFLILLGELDDGCLTTHDAYLLSPSRAIEIQPDSRIARCISSGKPVLESAGISHRCVFPIFHKDNVRLLVEMERNIIKQFGIDLNALVGSGNFAFAALSELPFLGYLLFVKKYFRKA